MVFPDWRHRTPDLDFTLKPFPLNADTHWCPMVLIRLPFLSLTFAQAPGGSR